MDDRTFWTACGWVLLGPPLLVVWVLALITLYGLGGGSSSAEATTARQLGTARVLSCEQAGIIGGWGVGSRQRCTAEVTIRSSINPDRVVGSTTLVLDTGVAGTGDIGRTVDVAVVGNDSAGTGGRLERQQDLLGLDTARTVIVRNQDVPTRALNDVLLPVGIGVPVVLLASAVTRSQPDRWTPNRDTGVTRTQVEAVPGWARSRRLRDLGRTARWGTLAVLLLTTLDRPTVLDASTAGGEGHRWPLLPDAAPLTLPIAGFLLGAAWLVTAFQRSRERVRAAQLLHLGPAAAAPKDRPSRWRPGGLLALAGRAELERRQVGDAAVVRRTPWPRGAVRWGFVLLAAVAALSWAEWARALPVHAQPWWVEAAATWTAVLLTVVTLVLAAPDETPVSRARRLLVLREQHPDGP